MPTISPVVHARKTGYYEVLLWEGIATGDTIVPAVLENLPLSLSVQAVAGTAGGATVVMNGSLISGAATLYGLDDLSSIEISFTASGGTEVAGRPLSVAPGISGGTGDDWDVYLLVRYA